jgi:hypothetical protein
MKQLILILLSFLFISCKKEIVNDRTRELLTKSWKMTSLDVITPLSGTPLEGQSSNWYTPGGCNSEMIWTFEKGGNLVIKDALSCIPSGTNGVYTNSWVLTNNNMQLDISGSPFGNFTYKLMSLTATKLVVQRNENVGYSGGVINLLIERVYTAQ